LISYFLWDEIFRFLIDVVLKSFKQE
jgi:hypothetical protein